jgi:signal transduction histidine kinase
MRRLIGSLLELARFESGQEPLQRVEFDLAVVVADGLVLLQPLAAERGIRLRSEPTASLYRGDADRMAQVVSNLLINAIEYNHPGGEVRVTTRRTDHAVELGVWNTGPSIPAEDLPHIFERFRRVDRSRDSSGHGGLGLAIAKSIVQAHGGVVAVRSDPENGTTFTVSLPV